MKRIALLLTVCLMAVLTKAQTWQKMPQTNGIDTRVNWVISKGGKLYAATANGVWCSASGTGEDWTCLGLQDKEVLFINADDKFIAFTQCDDAYKNVNGQEELDWNKAGTATRKAGQMYEYTGGVFELKNWNPQKRMNRVPTTGMAQIRNEQGNLVLIVPTWGDGIWRSEDGGETFEQVPSFNGDSFDDGIVNNVNVTGAWADPYTPGRVYATDKATGSDHYVLESTDYGKTWHAVYIGNVANPWTFFTRKMNGEQIYYFGGENGSDGQAVLSSTKVEDEAFEPFVPTDMTNGYYWHNFMMLGYDDGPMFVLLSLTGVFTYDETEKTLTLLGEGFEVGPEDTQTEDKRKHMSMAVLNGKLYVSGRTNFIQMCDVSNLVPSETGIKSVTNTTITDGITYDLQGRRTNGKQRGISLVKTANGVKKVIR